MNSTRETRATWREKAAIVAAAEPALAKVIVMLCDDCDELEGRQVGFTPIAVCSRCGRHDPGEDGGPVAGKYVCDGCLTDDDIVTVSECDLMPRGHSCPKCNPPPWKTLVPKRAKGARKK